MNLKPPEMKMSYRSYNNSSYGSRRRSEAWYMDGGANDEGYNHRYCSACGKKTEHDIADCIPCGDMAAAVSARVAKLAKARVTTLKKS